MDVPNKDGPQHVSARFIVCPNKECRKFAFALSLRDAELIQGAVPRRYRIGRLRQNWRLIPLSDAKVFPYYVPQAIREDYEEASRVKDLSPKAAASLARRCLQGMIRDFWGIKRRSLALEINALKGKVSPEVWTAIDAVRSVGNIGAHMEKDVNVIVEIEPDEAGHLIRLIEMLIKEWYVARHERAEQLKEVIALKAAKDEAKKQPPAAGEGEAIDEQIPAAAPTSDD